MGRVARMGDRKGGYYVFVGKQEGKKPLGGPNRKWEGNIKMDLQENGWIGVWAGRKLNLCGSG
jgi:hypothetical protein